MMLAAVAAIVFSSCGNNAKLPKAELNDDVDTLSYALGLAMSQGAKEYAAEAMKLDTAYMEEFYKGILDGMQDETDKGKLAYQAGMSIAQQLKNGQLKQFNYQVTGNDSTEIINTDNFLNAFINGIKGSEDTFLSKDTLNDLIPALMDQVGKRLAAEANKPNKEAGEKFMAEIAKKAGVKELCDGIYYEVITEGTGELPADTNTVKVNYEGKLVDGTVFDSSYQRGEPASFPVTAVIPGWVKALQKMPVGSTWMLYIPQEQAYGDRDMGQIKPFSALQFKVELIEIEK